MKKLIEIINTPGFAIQGKPVSDTDITQTNDELTDCGLPVIPKDLADFLRQCNGALRDGRCIWGIDNNKHFMYDILGENLTSGNPAPEDILLFGSTCRTFTAWLCSEKKYAIVDKSSFMVLHKFNNFIEAVKYILEIDD